MSWSDLNGRLLEADRAAVPAADLGLLYGIGLFTTMRARHGQVFRLQAHLQRLLASAEKLSLHISPEQLPEATRVAQLLAANELQDARLRLTVTGGTRDEQQVHHNVLLSAAPYEAYPQAYYTQGVTAWVCPQAQDPSDPLAGHKTTCYWPRLQALHEAQRLGCAEALWFTPSKRLAEGSISNVFLVKGDGVLTPPLETPVLPGITRSVVLDLCRQERVPCREAALTVADVLSADEAFLSNCIMGLVPLVRLERSAIGGEKPGPITRRLMAAYDLLVERECGASRPTSS